MSTAVVEITGASFTGCTWSGAVTGLCTATSAATDLPWTATARTTSDIQIHGVNIDVFLEHHTGTHACAAAGATIKITGTLSGGKWNGNGISQHELLLAPDVGGATGLVSHSVIGNGQPLTLTGTLRDTQQSLTVIN